MRWLSLGCDCAHRTGAACSERALRLKNPLSASMAWGQLFNVFKPENQGAFLLLCEVENAIQDLGNGRIHFPETFGHRTLHRCGQFDELTDQKFIAKGFLELFLA